MTDEDITTSLSPSSSTPGSGSQSPASVVSLVVSHLTSAAVSGWIAYLVAKQLPPLLQEKDWTHFAIACVSLVVIAAPTSAIPLLRAAIERLASKSAK